MPAMDQRLPGLDALRGIAAIMVVLFHLGLPIAGAHLAVDFFVMLSGFVMARTYEARLRSGGLGAGNFLARRYRRLWGWMALGTTIGLLAAVAEYGWSGELGLAWLLMLALVPAVNMSATPYLLNLPMWSIVYELVANAVHALGLVRLGRAGLALLALACALALAAIINTAGFPRGGFAEYHWLVLPRIGLAYVLGVLVCRLWGDRPPLHVPFAAAALALPAYVVAAALVPWQFAPLVFVLVLSPLMLLGGIGARFASPRAAELASLLGAASFPLYALHYPAIRLLRQEHGWLALAAVGLGLWLWHKRAMLVPAATGMALARQPFGRGSAATL